LIGIEYIVLAGTISERRDKEYRKQGGYKSAEIHKNLPLWNLPKLHLGPEFTNKGLFTF
jgi:hypothetical protein